jgi:predicted Zn-dependent protease
MSCFIDYAGIFYVFHGVAAESEFENYSALFEPSMRNFNKLTDPARLNVQPMKVRIRTVGQSGTLSSAFLSFGVLQDQMEGLAFLNNMELTDPVSAGTKIKIVE